MKPFYKSRKFWVSIITAVSTVVAYYQSPDLGKLIAAVGMTLVLGVGLEDFAKAKG